MKRKLLIPALALMAGCGPAELSPEQIREQIATYREQIAQLESQIETLDAQLHAADSSGAATAGGIGVEVMELRPEVFRHFFESNGAVKATQSAFISPEMNGQIKAVHVVEGQRVAQGQLLISLNDNVLRGSLAELRTSLVLADTLFRKQESLWRQNIGSELQYLEAKNRKEALEKSLETLQAQLELTQIRAPFSGVVDDIALQKGEMASPGMQVIRLVGLAQMTIEAEISENYLPFVQTGDSIWISFPTYPDLLVGTTIQRTGQYINPDNRTFQVEMKVNNPDERLKPNIVAVVRAEDFHSDQALFVPSTVIGKDASGLFVYLAVEEAGQTIAKKRYVQTGLSDANNTLITSGLAAGERVIVKGSNLAKQGMRLNVIN